MRSCFSMQAPGRAFTSLLFATVLVCAGAAAARATTREGFIVLAGKDTAAVERAERDAGQIASVLVYRMNEVRFDFRASLTAEGTIASLDLAVRRAGDGPETPAMQTASFTWRGDSVDVEQARLHTTIGTRAGSLPYLNPSFVLLEQVLRRARRLGGASVTVPLLAASGGRTFDATVRWNGPDSALVTIVNSTLRFAVDADGAILGGVMPEQGLVILRADALDDRSLQVPRPDYGAPPDAPYTALDVRVRARGGFELAGTLVEPKGARAKLPAVVTITGSGPEDRDEAIPVVRGYRPFRQLADALARRGIASLRLDDRGTGGSGGRFEDATSEDLSHDTEDAVAWLRARPEIDAARVALVGHSEGGLIAPMLAARDSKLAAIVLLAGPAYDGRRILEYQNRQAIERTIPSAASRDSALRAAMTSLDSVTSRPGWMRFFATYDPLPTARRVRTPVLLLQGETDHQVTPEQAELLERAFREGGDRDVTRRMLPATNHLFLPDTLGDPAGYPRLPVHEIPGSTLAIVTDWLASKFRR